jgi:NTP pyrophosphatase (non-canonical NTP hydrolase)
MRHFEEYFSKMIENQKPMNYEKLSELVLQWGEDKGIFAKSTPLRQLDKTQEELDETREALERLGSMEEKDISLEFDFVECFESDSEEAEILEDVKDGIGDMLVTIILLAKMVNMDTLDCLQVAYDVIKKRKGEMIDGQFVKNS